jgi:hypothetical protein
MRTAAQRAAAVALHGGLTEANHRHTGDGRGNGAWLTGVGTAAQLDGDERAAAGGTATDPGVGGFRPRRSGRRREERGERRAARRGRLSGKRSPRQPIRAQRGATLPLTGGSYASVDFQI